jgi:2-polyprenyl-3-methyl-5-hydroxy-6-metoxy-1,4-benzoquinol methylase
LENISGYKWGNTQPSHTQNYLFPKILRILNELRKKAGTNKIFEVGCGNGAFGIELIKCGFDVCGVDPSIEGIEQIKKTNAQLNFSVGSCYDPLHEQYGQFPIVISLEVIEHVYSPRKFARCIYLLLESGGTAIISTPYHGYVKNLILAITGKMDEHFTSLWDHGHIKFWSEYTLKILLEEAGFINIRFEKAGRFGPVSKSMIAIAKK